MARSSANDIELTVGLEAGDVTDAAENLRSSIKGIFDANAGKAITAAFAALQSSMANAYQSSVNLQTRLEELENTTFTTAEYEKLSAILDKLDSEMLELNKRKAELESSNKNWGEEYDAIVAKLETVENQAKEADAELTRMENSGEAFIPGVDTQEYEDLTQRLAGVNNQMSVLLRRSEDMDKVPPPTTKWEAFGRILSKVAIEALKMTKTLATVMIAKPLEAAAREARKLASELAKIGASSIKAGINGIARSVFGIKKSSDSTNDSVKKGIKLFIKYAFGVRSFFFLYRKIRKAITEGFGDMAQVSAPLNNQLSQLATSMLYLRNAVTAAFAPIASFVIPILTTLINVLAAAANAVGQFMAALFGQTSFVKAKKVYKDYAASLDKGAAKQQKNASKTQKKVDKLQKTIAGFDDVNILESKDDDKTPAGGGGGGAGGGGGMPWQDPSNMFETTDIEAKYKKLAEKIKGFFKKGDWEGLGKFIADGINTGFRAIDKVLTSTKVQERVSYVINAITRTFNSLVKNIDWPLIGKTFGDGINLIVKALNQLYTGIKWYSLGKSIANGLNSLITTVDWTAIGNLFANKLNAIINLAYGVITNFDWASAGQALGNAINGFFLKVDWNTLAQTLVDLVSGLFTGIQNVVATVKWDEIKTKLNKALNIIIKGVNWAKLRKDLLKGVNKLLSVIQTAITKVNWQSIGTTLGNSLTTIVSTVDWAKVAKILSTAFVGALSALSSAMASFNWGALGKAVGTFLANINWGGIFLSVVQIAMQALTGLLGFIIGLLTGFFGSIVQKIADYFKNKGGKDIVNGLYKGITTALKSIGSWVVSHIFKPFINAVKSAFGIASPSKQMQKQGKEITAGMLKGITDGLKSIGSWVKTNVFDKIYKAITTAFGIAGSVASKIITVGKSIISGLYSGITNNLKSVASWVKTNIFEKFKKAIDSAFGIAKGIASTLKSKGEAIISGIKKGVTSKFSDLKDYVKDIPKNLKDAMPNVFELFKSIGTNIADGIKSGISKKWESLKKYIKDKSSELKDPAKEGVKSNSPSKLFRDEVGITIPQGIAAGIDKGYGEAIKSINRLTSGIVDAGTQSISLPPIVGGQVIPYSIGKADAEEANTTLNQVLDMLKYNKDNSISIEELQSVFTDLFRRYMNVQLYLGDEQVARHANAGNVKLNRRYNTT